MHDRQTSEQEVEARRGKTSGRRRTPIRRLYNAFGIALLKLLVRTMWASYRIEKVIGAEHMEPFKRSEKQCAPCVWHQQLVLTAKLIYELTRDFGFKPCVIISPSVDGDVPAKLTVDLGGTVIRGSANKSGAKVLRDMMRAFRNGQSIVTAADGPTGPNRKFKDGVVLMARMARVPMIPVGFAADRAWYLRRWDNFMIPKPFARIVIAYGEPVAIPTDAGVRELEPWREQMENAVNHLHEQSNNVFAGKSE